MMLLADALERSLAARTLDDRDIALVETGRMLAAEIDYLRGHGWINRSGKFDNVSVAQFNRVLVELELTPLSRGDLARPTPGHVALQALREARAGRVHVS